MGEAHGRFFEPTLNQSIKLRQADPRVTSDAGAILLREIDHRLGLTADLGAALLDPRDPSGDGGKGAVWPASCSSPLLFRLTPIFPPATLSP